MTDPAFRRLERALATPPPIRSDGLDRTPRGQRFAAVLMLLTNAPDPSITFVTRAETLRRHAGQIALPGGRVDPGDVDTATAALREATEEIGLDPARVLLLGELPALWVPASRYDVTTVIATWDGGQRLHAVDQAETRAVHNYRISQLASAEVRVTAKHPNGFTGPAFILGEQFIWGLTAHLVDWVLELAGWDRPWDVGREIAIPGRYLRD